MLTRAFATFLAVLLALTACGPSPESPRPTPAPAMVAPATALPATTPLLATGTPDTAIRAALDRTRSSTSYRLHLLITAKVERAQGQVDETAITEFEGLFRADDADYWQRGAFSRPETGFPTGRLHVIRAGGRTYGRGPLPLAGADRPVWYVLDPHALPTSASVYDAHLAFGKLFEAVDLDAIVRTGAETVAGQTCDRYRGDEDSAPHMFASLVESFGRLAADRPVRQQLQEKGSTLTGSDTQIWRCPDGYLRRVEATYAYRPPERADVVTWTLTLRFIDATNDLRIAAPAGAKTPGTDHPPPARPAPASSVPAAAALIRQGQAQVDIRDYAAGIESFSLAIARDPRAVEAYFGRGQAHVELAQYTQAIDDYTQALALAPDFVDAYRRRGFARRKSGDMPGAIADYSEALWRNPHDAVACLGRGLAYGDGLGDWLTAYDDDTLALAIDPDYTSAYHNRAIARRNLGDYQGSVADATEEIRREPDDPSAYRVRALAYLQLQEWQRASDDLDVAIRLDPSDASAYCNRGAAYLGLKDYAAAERASSEAIRLDSSQSCAYLNRGKAREMLGRTAAALMDYEQALELARQCGCQDMEQLVRERIQKLQAQP